MDSAAPSSNRFSPDADRLRALAEFAAGAGHEINNPLATIIGRAQHLLRDEAYANRRQSLATIVAQAYRIRDMIGDVMLFARPPQPELQDIGLRAVARSVLERLAAELDAANCRIEFAAGDEIVVQADPVQLAIVWSELLRNAIQAATTGGVIEIAVTSDSDQATFTITDHGRGFTDLEREHAFDPFFSGRQAGRGLGFGLCKVAQIVHQHGGKVEMTSQPAGPTAVTISWRAGGRKSPR